MVKKVARSVSCQPHVGVEIDKISKRRDFETIKRQADQLEILFNVLHRENCHYEVRYNHNIKEENCIGYYVQKFHLTCDVKAYLPNYQVNISYNSVDSRFFKQAHYKINNDESLIPKDENYVSLKYIPIEFFATNATKIDLTIEQLENIDRLRDRVTAEMRNEGFPEMIHLGTGQREILLLPIDLENSKENVNLIEALLVTLNEMFKNDKAAIDVTADNPSRKLQVNKFKNDVIKEENLLGVTVVKERPEVKQLATLEQIKAFVDKYDKIREPDIGSMPSLPLVYTNVTTKDENITEFQSGMDDCWPDEDQNILPPESKRWNIPEFIEEHGLDLAYTKSWNKDGQIYVLRTCPWNPDHSNDLAYIIAFKNGAVTAGCHHEGCASENWPTLKEKLGIIEERTEGRQKQSTVILDALANYEFFHNWEGEAYAVVPSGNHREILKIKDKKFKRFIQREYYLKKKLAPGKEAIIEALEIAEMKGMYEGEERILEQRVAMTDNNEFFYDLADSDFRVVKITRDECVVSSDLSVNFVRNASMKPQVMPDLTVEPDQLMDLLKQYIRIKKEEDYYLFIVYLITCFIKKIPHPILLLHGEKGAAKSTTMTIVKRIVDPCVQDLLAIPTAIDNLSLILNNHYLPSFDNVGLLTAEQANLLCIAVTGGRRSKRTNYSDTDETFYDLLNCIQITGINFVSSQTDFLDRTITIEQERIKRNERKTEKKLWEAFDQDKPKILGAIFNTLKVAIPIYETVELEEVGRMADFTEWGYAIGQALGDKGDLFLNAYLKNQSKINDEALLSNPVSAAVIAYMRNKETWSGTTTTLLSHLESTAIDECINTRQKVWPADGSALSKRLKEVKSNLEDVGIFYENRRSGNFRQIIITNDHPISKEEEAAYQVERSHCQTNDFSETNVSTITQLDSSFNIIPVSFDDELD